MLLSFMSGGVLCQDWLPFISSASRGKGNRAEDRAIAVAVATPRSENVRGDKRGVSSLDTGSCS